LLWGALRDATGVAYALDSLGMGDLFQVDPGELRPLIEESVAFFRETGDQWGLATSLCTLGMVAIVSLYPAAAAGPIAEGLALSRAVGDPWGLARALHYAGELARLRGDDEQARALYEESLGLYHKLDHQGMAAIMLYTLGYITQRQGSPRGALVYFAKALAEHVTQGDEQNIGYCLGGIAGMAAHLGWSEQAAGLFGAADAIFERLGTSIWPVDKVDYDRNLAAARAQLGDDAFNTGFTAGRALTLQQAIAAASAVRAAIDIKLKSNEMASGNLMPAAQAWGLTTRELEILRLVASRTSDREIASLLSISPRTVMHHVSHILAKLGVANRRDAAMVAARHELI
jgi:DNA-binding CsgD family transcriptional regulator